LTVHVFDILTNCVALRCYVSGSELLVKRY